MSRWIAHLGLFTFGYAAVTYGTLALFQQTGIAAVVWPASALAVGMLVALGRRRVWPEMACVAVANGLIHYALGYGAVDYDVEVCVFLGIANGVAVGLGVDMLAHGNVTRDQPARVRAVLTLVLCAVCSPIPGAIIGGAALSVVRSDDPTSYAFSWWLVEAVSFLLLTPPFLFWRSRDERLATARSVTQEEAETIRRRRLIEITIAGLALAVAGFMVPITGQLVLIELSATVLLWFALRFGVFTTALTSAIYATCVIAAALVGFWPADGADRGAILLPLQATLALTTLPALLVAALVSQRERARRVLAADATRLAYALEGANEGLWDWQLLTGQGFLSERGHRMLGYEPGEFREEVLGWRSIMHPDDLPGAMQAFDDHAQGKTELYETEFRCRHKEGHWVWILDRGKVVERDAAGVAVRAVGTQTDISERKELERALEHLATHDPLTELANRGVFERGLVRAAARLDRQGGRMAVLLIDLDHFKAVNDTHGHAVGDALLVTVARRLRETARIDDLVARLGGDEFAVIAAGASAAEFDVLAGRILEAVMAPADCKGIALTPSVSIGVAVATSGAQVGDELVLRADRALYAAKTAGRGAWRFFGGKGRGVA